ncbi:BRCA1-associated ATM activator 1-like [Antedon mediterranea]|uniref:BRCA1-associated ATM activator 1-like n=1 Tax=Antedon mediterranea TaxID=105859 RepID=UPI003AF8B44A
MAFYTCMKFLPQVLDIVLKSEDSFKDDSFAEKLLDWLRTSSKTKEYYCNLVAETSAVVRFLSDSLKYGPNSKRTVFALKVLSILIEFAPTHKFDIACAFNVCGSSLKKECSTEQVVGASSEIKAVDVSSNIFEMHINQAQEELWWNPSVRCAWLEAVTRAVRVKSLRILQNGANEVAWNCLKDSSMFVKSAAEDFFVSTILQQIKTHQEQDNISQDILQIQQEQLKTSQETLVTTQKDSPLKKQRLQLEYETFQKILTTIINSDTFSLQQSSIEVLRKVLKFDPELGIKAIRQYNVVSQLSTFLTGSATTDVELDIIDLQTEIIKLSTVLERENICEIIQEVPMLLFHKKKLLAAISIASLLWRTEMKSVEKKNNMEMVLLPILLQTGELSECVTFVDKDCSVILSEICRQNKAACFQLMSTSLNLVLENVKEMDLTEEETMHILKLLVKLLEGIHEQCEPNPLMNSLIGSTKLSKKCFDILAIVCKSKSTKVMPWPLQLLCSINVVVQDPNTDVSLLTKALEVACCLDSLYSTDDGNILASGIQKLIHDPNWERRDSGVGFIDHVLRIGTCDIVDWVKKHKVSLSLWERIKDTESYVRATAAVSMSRLLLLSKDLTEAFLTECNLSKEDVLMELCRIVATDDGGFARRAAIESLSLLTHDRDFLSIILKFNPESCESFNTVCQTKQPTIAIADFQGTDNQTDIFPTDIENAGNFDEHKTVPRVDHTLIDKSTNTNMWNFCMVAVNQALSDIDWEVKIKAIDFWADIMKIILKDFLPNENKSCNYTTNHSRLSCLVFALTCLHKMGLQKLMESVSDHDRLVGVACCKVLIKLRNGLTSNGLTIENLKQLIHNQKINKSIIMCNCCEKLRCELGFTDISDFKSNLDFVMELLSTNFDKIVDEKSLIINDYSTNPLLLLEDIVATATPRDGTEQLIDCY